MVTTSQEQTSRKARVVQPSLVFDLIDTGRVVMTARGQFDGPCRLLVEHRLDRLTAGDRALRLRIDFREVDLLDASVAEALGTAAARLNARGGALEVVGASTTVAETLALSSPDVVLSGDRPPPAPFATRPTPGTLREDGAA